jgi:hypothetical protein
MDGVVVDVAEDGPGPEPVSGVLAVDVFTQFVHDITAGLLASLKSSLLLIQNLRIKFEVDMFNPLEIDPTLADPPFWTNLSAFCEHCSPSGP